MEVSTERRKSSDNVTTAVVEVVVRVLFELNKGMTWLLIDVSLGATLEDTPLNVSFFSDAMAPGPWPGFFIITGQEFHHPSRAISAGFRPGYCFRLAGCDHLELVATELSCGLFIMKRCLGYPARRRL